MKEFKHIMEHCSEKTRRAFWRNVIVCGVACVFLLPVVVRMSVGMLQDTGWRIQYYHNRQISLLAAATNTKFLFDAIFGIVLATCVPIPILVTRYIIDLSYGTCAKSLKTKEILEADHGRTMLAVARRIRWAPVEYGATFLPGMRKVGEYTNYDAARVGRTEECLATMRNISGCIDIHNHPDAISIPSSGDLQFYSCNYVSRAIILAGDEVTILDIPSDFWQNEQVQELIKQQYVVVLQQGEALSAKRRRAAYLNFMSQLANKYDIKSKTLPFWRWYTSEIMLAARRGYHYKRRAVSVLLANITSCQKAQR